MCNLPLFDLFLKTTAAPNMGNEPSVHSRPLVLGKPFPNVKGACNKTASTPEGTIDFGEYTAGSWAILFSHPAAFTPICTTELASVAKLAPEFAARGVKVGGGDLTSVVAFGVVLFCCCRCAVVSVLRRCERSHAVPPFACCGSVLAHALRMHALEFL